MYLSLTPPLAAKITGSGLKHSLSAVLTGMTAIGTCSALIFNLDKSNSISKALNPVKNTYVFNLFSKGILNLNNTFKDWSGAIFNSKDAFIDWLNRYFDVNGFKSGTVTLYHKLYDWGGIVYNWFATKFLKFIENIPKMVQNWRELRLSLFKWGTFLGGGGGSALWAMFGSGNNWGKLADLLGNPEFADVADKFSKLLEDNGSAFTEMNEEEAKEIFDAILDDPKEAGELLDELLEDQKKKNEEKKKELKDKGEENKEPQEELKKEEIIEKFKNSGGGSPNNPIEAFGHMVGSALQGLAEIPTNQAWSKDMAHIAKEKMKKYIETIREDVKKKARKSDVKEKFLEAIKGNEETFAFTLAEAAKEAYEIIKQSKQSKQSVEYGELAEKFGEILENKFTVEATEDEEGESISIREKVPKTPPK